MKKILLVDDDTSLLEVLGDFLEGEGYSVTRAGSGEEALAKLRAGTAPSLIVLDMMMPGIGGAGVLDALARPDGSFRFPVLVLTAKAAMSEYFADKKVDGFLAKPCSPDDLAAEVARIVFQTAGAAAGAGAHGRTVYVADPSSPRREAIAAALGAAGYATMDFPDAASLVQECVTAPPSAVAVPLSAGDGLGAAALSSLLKGMSATASVRTFVYGIGAAGADVDAIVSLDPASATAIPGDSPAAVLAAIDGAFLP